VKTAMLPFLQVSSIVSSGIAAEGKRVKRVVRMAGCCDVAAVVKNSGGGCEVVVSMLARSDCSLGTSPVEQAWSASSLMPSNGEVVAAMMSCTKRWLINMHALASKSGLPYPGLNDDDHRRYQEETTIVYSLTYRDVTKSFGTI